MSASGTVGALRIILGGDTSELDKALKGSQSSIASWSTGLKVGMLALAAAITGAAAAAGVAISHAIDNADQLNKMSQKTGLTTEELSKLSYAAQLADVSQEALGKSMGKLSKAMIGAVNDGASPAAQAFREMGVSLRDQATGNIRSASDVLGDVAAKFVNYRDGAAKTALAIELFGKAGAAMIPLLNQGRDGLQQAADEAERFGIVIDKKTAVAAENFNDNLKRLDKIKQGIWTTIASKLLPSFEALSEVMVRSRTGGVDLWAKAGEGLATVMNSLVTAASALITTWQQVFATAANLKAAFDQLKSGDFSGAWETMKKSAADTAAAFADLGMRMKSIWSPDETDAALKQMSASVDAFMGNIKTAAEFMKTDAPWKVRPDDSKALENFLKNQEKKTAATLADAQTTGMSAAAQANLKLQYEAQAIALANNIPLTEALQQRIAAAGNAAAMAQMQLQAAQIAQTAMSPAEKYAQDLASLQTIYASTNMTMETFAARQQQLAEGVGATWNQAGAGMASGFAALATQFGKSSKEMAVAAKAFGIIEATINTYTAFTKALASAPPPFNYVMAAGVLAAGMAKVMAIKSQSIGGFKTGGSFTVGGTGGPDSQFVPIMATPGEQVDIWRPGEGGERRGNAGSGGQKSSGGTAMVYIDAALRPLAEALIPQFNAAMRDGHELKLAPA